MKKLLSLIALAGIFAACQPEEIETAFEVPEAVANIKVVAVDIRTNTQVTPASVTASVGTYSAGVVTITGTPTISKQTVTLSVSYKADYMAAAKAYPASLDILALRAGGKAEYSVTVVVGELSPIPDYTFAVKQTAEVVTSDRVYFTPEDGQALIEYDGKKWAKNNSEYLLTGKVTWSALFGSESSNFSFTDADSEFEPYAQSYADAYNTGITPAEQEPYEITVSAYSYYTVYVTRMTTEASYTVYKVNNANKEETAIASFDVKSVIANQIEYEEIADPDSHGHYQPGHGHSHGGDNAGGGIVYAE